MRIPKILAAVIVVVPALRAQDPKAPQDPDKPKTSIQILREAIEAQRVRLDEEIRKLGEMSLQLQSLERLSDPPEVAGPPAPDESKPQEPQEPEVSEFRESDPAEVKKEDYVEERDPLVGDFPGSMKIPGTQTSVQLGGFVKLNIVRSWDSIGSDNQFVVPSIPVQGSPEAGKGPRTSLSARQTRLHLDLRMPTGDNYLRAFIEIDFAGGGDDADLVRLRHAFGQFDMLEDGYVLAGKSWTTFMDVASQPDGIDFEGLVGTPFRRNALVRWSRPVSKDVTFAISIEDPDAEVTGGESINDIPDLSLSWRWKKDWGHLYFAAIGRKLEAEQVANSGQSSDTAGYGVTLSGSVDTPWSSGRDKLRFGATWGRGIGSYLTGTSSEGSQDALFNPVTGELEALPVFGMHTSLEHWWSDTVRSNLTYSYNLVDNTGFQSPDSYHEGHYAAFNVLWSITPNIVLGAEQLYGVRRDKNGASGNATQTQVAFKFSF